MPPKLNILLQNWENFRFHHYKGNIATRIELFERTWNFNTVEVKMLPELNILLHNWVNFRFHYHKRNIATQLEYFDTKLREFETVDKEEVATLIECFAVKLRNLEISLLQRWCFNSNWTLCYKIERSWDLITIQVVLLLKLNSLLQNWENLKFEFFAFYQPVGWLKGFWLRQAPSIVGNVY